MKSGNLYKEMILKWAGCVIRATGVLAIMTILLFLQSDAQVDAATRMDSSSPVTIKVAYYLLDGFFEYDESGNECGYGVDYLNELTKYANIQWEYIPVDSWEKIGPMIRAGEADVRMPVSEPTTPSAMYNYTVEDVLPTYHAIMTLKSYTDLYYEDYDRIAQMKLAVVEGLVQKTGVLDYLTSIGAQDHLVYYDDYNSCKEALIKGEVDGLMSNIMDLTEDMKILDKFAATKNYITTLKDSPYYTIINAAMTELELENPSFQTTLYEKYYPERTTEPFTREESEYIRKTDSLKLAVYTDRKPVSYYDQKSNTYKGIAIEIANEISKNIGITFEYVPITTESPADMLDAADLAMPVTKNIDDTKYFATNSILDSNIVMVARAGVNSMEGNEKIGVLSKTEGIRKIISERADYQIMTYETNQEALQALQSGEIDGFVNSLYVLNYWLENPRYSNLSMIHYQSVPLEYSICGKADHILLQSVLNKGIAALSAQDVSDIINSSVDFSMSDMSILDKLYVYRYECTMVGVILLILLAVILLYNHSRTIYVRNIEEKSNEQEKANKAKTEFLSRMSHDMRTPMNAIIGMSYLGMKTDSVVELQDYHEKINNSGKYLLGLINDTLDMTKMDNDKMELHIEPYSLSEFIESINVMFAQKEKEKNIHLLTHSNVEKDKILMMDKLRIQQIFVNLINNAIKFSDEGQNVELDIHIGDVSEEKSRITAVVRDHGCGMSQEFQKKMYEPFEQEARKETGSETGTGLGLSIVNRLVRLMNGTISCESKIGTGTTFTVVMEVSQYHKTAADSLSSEKTIEDACIVQRKNEHMLQGMRILLCEDHPLNTQIAVKLLEREGVIVETAANGSIGLGMFKQSASGYYKAILMDIRMPVMDGLTAARRIRASDHSDAETIPIIAMTANAFDEDMEESFRAGMNEHLAKPIDAQILYETLKKYC